jgi:hypothetical protein
MVYTICRKCKTQSHHLINIERDLYITLPHKLDPASLLYEDMVIEFNMRRKVQTEWKLNVPGGLVANLFTDDRRISLTNTAAVLVHLFSIQRIMASAFLQ